MGIDGALYLQSSFAMVHVSPVLLGLEACAALAPRQLIEDLHL
jgi:hypothetical protein